MLRGREKRLPPACSGPCALCHCPPCFSMRQVKKHFEKHLTSESGANRRPGPWAGLDLPGAGLGTSFNRASKVTLGSGNGRALKPSAATLRRPGLPMSCFLRLLVALHLGGSELGNHGFYCSARQPLPHPVLPGFWPTNCGRRHSGNAVPQS